MTGVFCVFSFSILQYYSTFFSLALFLMKILPHSQLFPSVHSVVFLCLLLRFLFITGFEHCDYYMDWCHLPHGSCAWTSWSLLNLWVYTFQQIQKHFSHYFFKCIFCTPPHFSCVLKLHVYYVALIIYLIISLGIVSIAMSSSSWIFVSLFITESLLIDFFLLFMVYIFLLMCIYGHFLFDVKNILNFNLWDGRYFCIFINIIEFCSALQLSYLEIFWKFGICCLDPKKKK